MILSLLGTARNHDVNPRLYLNDIITRMPYM
ncbi:MAG: transposase domain-containing protein [Muribaculaceae bacterium]|nr:transposase domain-containing protein [Muribaculaceae bacterium]